MVVSYIEEIVAEYYRLQNYLVDQNWDYQVPKEKSGKKVSEWKDIDVLAFNKKEVLIIECKAFTGSKKAEEMSKELLDDFRYAEEAIKKKVDFLVKQRTIKKILVVETSIKKVEEQLEEKGIEVILLKEMMRDFLGLLKGAPLKQKHPVTRTLKFLVENKFGELG